MKTTVTTCYCDICREEISQGFQLNAVLYDVAFMIETKRWNGRDGVLTADLCRRCYKDTLLTIVEDI